MASRAPDHWQEEDIQDHVFMVRSGSGDGVPAARLSHSRTGRHLDIPVAQLLSQSEQPEPGEGRLRKARAGTMVVPQNHIRQPGCLGVGL
jgi:hypothetical protein